MARPILISSATGVATPTIPTHQTGDFILVFAFRDGSTTIPSLPSGYVPLTTRSDPNGLSCRLGYKVATSSSESPVTWTDATTTIVTVWRGVVSTAQISSFGSSVHPGEDLFFPSMAIPSSADPSRRVQVLLAGHTSNLVTPNSPLSPQPTQGSTLITSSLDSTDYAVAYYIAKPTNSDLLFNRYAATGQTNYWTSTIITLLGGESNSSELNKTLDSVTISSTTLPEKIATTSKTIDSFSILSDSKVLLKSSLAKTVDSVSVSSTSSIVSLIGQVSRTIGDVSVSSTGAALIKASFTNTQNISSSIIGRVDSSGVLATLDGITISSQGRTLVKGVLNSGVSSIALSSGSKVPILSMLNNNLDSITSNFAGRLDIKADLQASISVDVFARSQFVSFGASTKILDGVSISSTSVRFPFSFTDSTSNNPFITSSSSNDYPYDSSSINTSDNPYRS